MDSVYEQIGEFGRYQTGIFIATCLVSFFNGPHVVLIVFLEAPLQHRCFVPNCDDASSLYDEPFLNFTTPYDSSRQGWSQCAYNEPENTSHNNCSPLDFSTKKQIHCSKWIYDHQQYSSNYISEFDLVCQRQWIQQISGTLYMFGMFVGGFLMGYVSDLIGRKRGLLISVGIYVISATGVVFSPNAPLYLVFRFFQAIGGIAMFNAGFVIAVEFVGVRWRTLCGVLIEVPFSLGEASIGLVAYFVRDSRWLTAICTLPAVLLLSFYWILPESVRWLILKGRNDEALKIIQKAAKVNGLEVPHQLPRDIQIFQSDCQTATRIQDVSFLKMMKFSNIRKRTLILSYCWIICTMVYYGISMNTGALSGNIYVNFSASMLIELPAHFFAYFALERIGRKGTLCSVYMICGFACVVAGFLPSNLGGLIVALNLIGKFGIAAAFTCIALFTTEIYPTEYRSIGLGTCSTLARLGGLFAPIFANLSAVYSQLPILIFGCLSITAGLSIMILPETTGAELPQTLAESDQFGMNQPLLSFKLIKQTEKNDLPSSYQTC